MKSPAQYNGDLPEGWSRCLASDITAPVANMKPGDEPNRVFRYIDISSIDNVRKRVVSTQSFTGDAAPSRARRPVQPGDVIFSNVRTYLRNIAKVPDDIDVDLCSTGFTVMRSNGAVLPEYLFHYTTTNQFVDPLTEKQTGSSYPAVTDRIVLESEIALPPLAEQKRIVAKVEALLERTNKARERLDRVPGILKRFRQSVLAAACSGRLTVDWREENPEIETAAAAVERIREGGGEGRTRRGSREIAEPSTEMEGLELPDTWAYARTDELVEVGTVITYGIVLPGPQVDDGVPYIRGQDINDKGRILVEQLAKTAPEIAAKHERSKIQEGDVLLCVIRNLRVAVVPQGLDGFNLTQGTVRLRPSDVVLAEYLAAYLASPYAQEWMKQRYVGLDMPRINVRDSRAIPVALPPVAEQREIVRKVRDLFDAAERTESLVELASMRANRVTQSVLAKAFAGELVETEADRARREGRDYESASVLLERISAERSARSNGTPKRASRTIQRKARTR